MHASDLFPFLSLLPAHKMYATPSIPIDRVLLFPDVKALPKQVLDLYAPMCNMIYFKNIDVYVPNTNCLGELVSTYRELINPTREKPTWLISEVNTNFIDIEESNNDIYSVRKIGGSFRLKISENLEYFKALIGKVDVKPYLLSNPSLAMFQGETAVPVAESDPFAGNTVGNFDPTIAEVSTIFGTFEELKIYLESGTSENVARYKAVPLLVGHTGVSKSAIIKSLVETTSTEYGLRLIDIRVSFMDRLDFTGVMELIGTDDGEKYAEAPIRELVVASDPFLKTVRGFLDDPTYAEKLKKEPKTYSRLIELAKTPVIVFEEVNRCETAIRQVLTDLLNKKQFLTYPFTEARAVATANMPVGTDKDVVESLGTAFYIADGFGDAAYRKRFIFIEIDPTTDNSSGKSIKSSWLNWAYGPPMPRAMVKIKDSYVNNANYKKLKITQDNSLVGKYAIVKEIVSKDFKDESQIQFSVYLCDTTPEILDSLNKPKNLQKFIEKTISNDLFFTVLKDDLVEFDPKINSVKLTSNNSSTGFSTTNLHPMILKYLNTAEGQKDIYNLETVSKESLEDDITVVRSIPMTTFRSWEFASNILKEADAKKEFYVEAFTGIMDKETVKRFVKFLTDNGYKKVKPKNVMSSLLEVGVNSGTPVMIIGQSSQGKTSQVEKTAKDNDMILIPLVLSATSKVNMKGFPIPENPVDAIFTPGDVDKSNVLQIFSEYYKGNKFSVGEMVSIIGQPKGNAFKILSVLSDGQYELQEYNINTQGKEKETVGKPISVASSDIHVDRNLPSKVSYNAQSAELVKKLTQARALNKKILFFIDEINRVTSPITMSCVLEAISDKRIMGIDFSGVDMTVVAACNVGDAHRDTIALDPAFLARFLVIRKGEADIDDFRSFMAHAEDAVKEGKLNPILLDTIKKLGTTEDERYKNFSKLFYEPETEGDQDRVFSSTRMLGVLSKFLASNTLHYPIKGKRIAKDMGAFKAKLEASTSAEEFFAGWLGQSFDKPIELTDAASGNKLSVNIRGETKKTETGETKSLGLMSQAQSVYFDKLSTLSKKDKNEIAEYMFQYVSKVEQHFVTARAEMVKTWLNVDASVPAMKTFVKVFNEVCDDSMIEWDDLINSELVLDYFLSLYTVANKNMSLKNDFPTLFKKAVLTDFQSYKPVDYANWFIALYKQLVNVNAAAILQDVIGNVISDKDVYELLRGTVDNAANDLLEKSLPNI